MAVKDITVRAANPDQDGIVGALPDLFRKLYGGTFPLKQVYDPMFWRGCVNDRFISVVVLEGREIIGHVALVPDKFSEKHVQLAFPAFDPERFDLLGAVSAEVSALISRVSSRQEWQMMYYFSPSPFPAIQLFMEPSFHEVALLPSYLAPGEFRARGFRPHIGPGVLSKRRNVMMSMKFVGHAPEARVIYPPKSHAEFIKELYQPLGLPREFRSSGKVDGGHPLAPEVEVFQRTGVQHISIVPSQISWRLVEEAIQTSDLLSYVLIHLADPACQRVCERFEDLGFVVSGVVPEKDGGDRLVLAPPNAIIPEVSEFVSPRAREIVAYASQENQPGPELVPLMRGAGAKSGYKVV